MRARGDEGGRASALTHESTDARPHADPDGALGVRSPTEPDLADTPHGEPTDLLGCMVGSYRIDSVIGSGGMGCVYRASHPQIGAEVAIKVLLPEIAASADLVERFVQEARASSAIGSPHIPRYLDFGWLSDGRAYAVMELLEGETLAERIARTGPLPLAEVVRIVGQAADALGRAHAARVVHRDIKPENLFLARDLAGAETLKVLDFGIAKLLTTSDAALPSTRMTQAGMFIGTPAYCAPEQMYGGAVGPQTDVYALGVTTFELLTGVTPFAGDLSELAAAKASGAIPSARAYAPQLPAVVDETLARAMAPAARDRFATMDALLTSVRAWSAHGPPAHAPENAPVLPRRAPPIAIAGAVIAAAIVAGAVALLASGGERPQTPEAVTPAPQLPVSAPRPSAASTPSAAATPSEEASTPSPRPAAAPPEEASAATETPAAAPAPGAGTPRPDERPRSAGARPPPTRAVRAARPARTVPEAPRDRPASPRTIIADPFAE